MVFKFVNIIIALAVMSLLSCKEGSILPKKELVNEPALSIHKPKLQVEEPLKTPAQVSLTQQPSIEARTQNVSEVRAITKEDIIDYFKKIEQRTFQIEIAKSMLENFIRVYGDSSKDFDDLINYFNDINIDKSLGGKLNPVSEIFKMLPENIDLNSAASYILNKLLKAKNLKLDFINQFREAGLFQKLFNNVDLDAKKKLFELVPCDIIYIRHLGNLAREPEVRPNGVFSRDFKLMLQRCGNANNSTNLLGLFFDGFVNDNALDEEKFQYLVAIYFDIMVKDSYGRILNIEEKKDNLITMRPGDDLVQTRFNKAFIDLGYGPFGDVFWYFNKPAGDDPYNNMIYSEGKKILNIYLKKNNSVDSLKAFVLKMPCDNVLFIKALAEHEDVEHHIFSHPIASAFKAVIAKCGEENLDKVSLAIINLYERDKFDWLVAKYLEANINNKTNDEKAKNLVDAIVTLNNNLPNSDVDDKVCQKLANAFLNAKLNNINISFDALKYVFEKWANPHDDISLRAYGCWFSKKYIESNNAIKEWLKEAFIARNSAFFMNGLINGAYAQGKSSLKSLFNTNEALAKAGLLGITTILNAELNMDNAGEGFAQFNVDPFVTDDKGRLFAKIVEKYIIDYKGGKKKVDINVNNRKAFDDDFKAFVNIMRERITPAKWEETLEGAQMLIMPTNDEDDRGDNANMNIRTMIRRFGDYKLLGEEKDRNGFYDMLWLARPDERIARNLLPKTKDELIEQLESLKGDEEKLRRAFLNVIPGNNYTDFSEGMRGHTNLDILSCWVYEKIAAFDPALDNIYEAFKAKIDRSSEIKKAMTKRLIKEALKEDGEVFTYIPFFGFKDDISSLGIYNLINKIIANAESLSIVDELLAQHNLFPGVIAPGLLQDQIRQRLDEDESTQAALNELVRCLDQYREQIR